MKKMRILTCGIICTLLFIVTITAQNKALQFEEGMDAYHNKNYVKARELLAKVGGDSEIDKTIAATAKFYAAECLYALDQKAGAAAEFEHFVENYHLSNFRDLALYRLGTIYFEQEQYWTSRNRLITLIEEYPESEYTGNAYYWAAETYFAENKFTDAEEFFTQAIAEQRGSKYLDYTIYSLGNMYERLERYEDAVAAYDELLAYYGESELAPYAQLRIGICYFNLKEYDSVVLELSDPLISELPQEQQTEAMMALANSFFRLREYGNAADIFQNILNRIDDDGAAKRIRYSLGWINFQTNNYEEAYGIFSSLSKTGSDTIAVNSLYWSAEAKRYNGELNAALDIYEEFLNTYGDSELAPDAIFNAAVIYYNSGDLDNAKRFLIQSSAKGDEETRAKAFTLLGEISLKQKNFREAETYFRNGIKEPGIDEELYGRSTLGLAVANFYLDDYDEALIHLSDLHGSQPSFERNKVNFYLAETHFAEGNFNDALRYYNAVNASDTDLVKDALYGKAYTYFNQKDFANSSYYLKQYLDKYPRDSRSADVKQRLADSYYGMKDFEKASELYGEAFVESERSLTNDAAYYQYGQTLFKAGKSTQAIRKLRELQSRFPNSRYADEAQYLIGWINFQLGDFNEAVNEYKALFNKYPRSALRPIAYYSIGDSYFNIGNYDSALEFYTKLIDEYPNTRYVFDAVNGIQYAYVAKDQPDRAVAVMDRFVDDNPNSEFSDDVLFKKGEIYYSLGNYREAKEAYADFIDRYPSSTFAANAHYWIGKSSAILGEQADAKENFKRVYEAYPNSEVGLSSVLELGKIYREEENYEDAVELYDRASGIYNSSSNQAELIYEKAVVQVKAGQIQEAYRTFNEVITYNDGTLFADKSKIELGLLELERGGYENAELVFSELGQRRTDDLGAQAQYYYGVTLLEQEKTREAIAALVRVRSVFSGYDEWYTKSLMKLGDAYVKINDKRQAREMYRAVISRHPNDDIADEARRKMRGL